MRSQKAVFLVYFSKVTPNQGRIYKEIMDEDYMLL